MQVQTHTYLSFQNTNIHTEKRTYIHIQTRTNIHIQTRTYALTGIWHAYWGRELRQSKVAESQGHSAYDR